MTVNKMLAALAVVGLVGVAKAGDRSFAYSYDTETLAPGAWEYEQWITWKHYSAKERYDFRHELEYGLTDRLLIGLYLADWRYEHHRGGKDKADYRDTAVELIYQLTDPAKAWLGSALYGEVAVGDEKVALETKLLLQKNVGRFKAVYNVILEAEWEGESLGDLDEDVGVWGNTAGLSYALAPQVALGLEAIHEQELAHWSEEGDHLVYAGPNVSIRYRGFIGALAALHQVTDIEGEAKGQLRLIGRFDF